MKEYKETEENKEIETEIPFVEKPFRNNEDYLNGGVDKSTIPPDGKLL